MNALPGVVTIVLNWNGLEDTRACLRSLLAQRSQPNEVYLIDNGSTDGSPALLREEFPDCTHIAHPSNQGFARANNAAMKRALAEGAAYVLLLNNDTTVAPDFLQKLVAAAEAEARIGMVVPKIYLHERPDEIWFAGSRICFTEWYPFRHVGEGEKDQGQFDLPGEPDFATACCVLVRAEMIRQIGMLDPAYGFYCEDVDWSLRARAAGWRIAYEPRARIWHRVNRSMRRGQIDPNYYSYRNVALVARRHLGWARAWPVVWLVVSAAGQNALYPSPSRLVLVEAARDAILGRTGIVARLGSSFSARCLVAGIDLWLRLRRLMSKLNRALRRPVAPKS